ncbi:bacteriocin fulvocin C-related protein [Streptomyces sp. NPDC048419]|uniref:bacteriocin fulvocin C-related protein n=1 Tax=Streptomyces sp. NPDC048419 TaxID=3365547 RepID=UPI00371248C7
MRTTDGQASPESEVRWMLAFDASCSTCRAVSSIVFNACEARLEVVALGRADVRAWRSSALGPDAPWAPTLMKVTTGTKVTAGTGDDAAAAKRSVSRRESVRAWTGPAMTLQLLRRLGPRATVRVLRALGEAREENRSQAGAGSSRAQFLRVAGGLAVASTILFKGGAPAFAEGQDAVAANAWVEANAKRLPTTYADVTALPLAHRRAVHAALPPAARSRLWVEHIDRFRAAHTPLTPRQSTVIARARDAASDPATFHRRPLARPQHSDLTESAIAAFGMEEAVQLLAALGPSETLAQDCACSSFSDACLFSDCIGGGCAISDGGCGEFWIWDCDGTCR